MTKFAGLFLSALLTIFTAASHANVTLKLGSKAPPLTPETWVQGKLGEGFAKGEVYVVEFWGTWCPPCVGTLPHVVELNRTYAGRVNFVGVSALNDTLAEVKEFIRKFEPKIEYPIGLDTSEATWNAWLAASGAKGIPTAFVVDRDGTIAFIGYPTELDSAELGNPIAQIAAGTWKNSDDYKRYEQKFNEDTELDERINAAYDGLKEAEEKQDWEAALQAVESGIAIGEQGNLNDFMIQKADILMRRLNRRGEAEEMLPDLIKHNWSHVQGLGAVLPLTIGWNLEVGHDAALQVLNLINFHSDESLRVRYQKYRYILLPPVAEFYSMAGMPALAAYYQSLAVQSAVADSEDDKVKELTEKLELYRNAAKPVPVCKDGVCEIPRKSALDILLSYNPATELEAQQLVTPSGQLPFEALGAPYSLVETFAPEGKAALYAVATNPLAKLKMRMSSIDALSKTRTPSQIPMVLDYLAKFLVEKEQDLGRYDRPYETMLNKVLEAAARLESPLFTQPVLQIAEHDKRVHEKDRAQAIHVLGALQANEATDFLINILKTKSSQQKDPVTRAAVVALGEIGDARALPVLADIIGSGFYPDEMPQFANATVKIGLKLKAQCEQLLAAQESKKAD